MAPLPSGLPPSRATAQVRLSPQPSTWEVHARLLLQRGECHVSHRLWMAATVTTLPSHPKLRLCWELRLRFDLSMARCLGAELRLVDYLTNDQLGPGLREKVRRPLAPPPSPHP